eukprot:TRINITY_DN1037_c0_g1_i3.p1 TRINITY_DN1037_c0_g1~~TRINITY_DN1037_c0_g1_i3.p1  ORF type:complete len:884 (+),score=178.84 TRINITY_DN1037_c0_g1_i3:80-2731(+)
MGNKHSKKLEAAQKGGLLDLTGEGITHIPGAALKPELNIRQLYVSKNNISVIPAEIGRMVSLNQLVAQGNKIAVIPPEMGNLINMHIINLAENAILEIPIQFGAFLQLTKLDVSKNRLKSIPRELAKCRSLRVLNVSYNDISQLPVELSMLVNLTYLDATSNSLRAIPPELGNLSKLNKLEMSCNQLSSVPPQLFYIQCLTNVSLHHNWISELPPVNMLIELLELNLRHNRIQNLPTGLSALTKLRVLLASHNFLQVLPEEIGYLQSLVSADFSFNLIQVLPQSFCNLRGLVNLNISRNKIPMAYAHYFAYLMSIREISLADNQLFNLPPNCFQVWRFASRVHISSCGLQTLPTDTTALRREIEELDISENNLSFMPDEYGFLSKLVSLNIFGCSFQTAPNCIASLLNIRQLYLGYNRIVTFPDFLCELRLLEILHIGGNHIQYIPPSIGRLQLLKDLFVSSNPIQALPSELGACVSLVKLDASYCLLSAMPADLSYCLNLLDLNISHNRLSLIPESFALLKNLKHVYLQGNQFQEFPKPFRRMPWLSSLTWEYNLDPAGSVPPPDVQGLSCSEDSLQIKNGFVSTFRVSCSQTIGRRPYNEDAVTLKHGLHTFQSGTQTSFFGVYDGHGGRMVAQYVANNLHHTLLRYMRAYPDINSQIMKDLTIKSFFELNDQMRKNRTINESLSGSTASICFVNTRNAYDPARGQLRQANVIMANIGDSRSVMYKDGRVSRVSLEHKPHLPEEMHRIRQAGGFVGDDQYLNALLAVSRAFGDFTLDPYLDCTPYFVDVGITSVDTFIILATDGLWDVISDEEACEFVLKCPDAARSAVLLRDYAYLRGSSDNISVLVVDFRDDQYRAPRTANLRQASSPVNAQPNMHPFF